ncbi:hypothetical protein INR75_13340 [Zunongwangia sp. SCSIO 43204]|uniref:hypothetical protein n=1 Tax=Zunongwangia TaxID=417127 RepID=UPI001CA8C772|nr:MULTISPECIES: hypothetical protein [Zunongwangia]UAB83175.1 hypothetical protein INR75_13340 [Zunongwangia sp. SCSIO 43204]
MTIELNDGYQVHKVFSHLNVSDVNCPDLIGTIYSDGSQLIRINLVFYVTAGSMTGFKI